MRGERQGKRGPRRALWLAAVLVFASCTSGSGGVARERPAAGAPAAPETYRPAPPARFSFEHPAMGTLFRVTLYARDEAAAREASDAAFAAVDAIEAAATDYDSESEARRLPAAALGAPLPLSPELLAVVAAADAAARLSDGAFDPTVGALTPEWRRALRRRRWPATDVWAAAHERVGWARLTRFDPEDGTLELLAPDMRVDFGAVAKGVAVDAALRTLSDHGVDAALVDGGGDLGASAPPPGATGWRVSVRPGGAAGGALGECRALLAHGAVATSGDAYRSAEGLAGAPLPGVDDPAARFGHVLDARTGAPLPAPRASVVFAPTAARADGLATALLVLGRPALRSAPFAASAFLGGDECAEAPCVGSAFPQDGALYDPAAGAANAEARSAAGPPIIAPDANRPGPRTASSADAASPAAAVSPTESEPGADALRDDAMTHTNRPESSASAEHGDVASFDRRSLMRAGSAAAAAAAVGQASALARGAQESDATKRLRIGLVGCGGRGGSAVFNALQADDNTELVALGDVFEDRIESKLGDIMTEAESRGITDRIKVPAERRFVGFDCHESVTDACDVVLFASTPHFRPAQVEYAVRAGKHMFVEKPVATDAPGLRRIWQACNDAKGKGLALVTGLCYRYQPHKVETFARIREGLIGEIKAIECSYDTGALWFRQVADDASDMEKQLRNWLYYTWASGDHVAEQAIHNLDKMIWAMDDVPPLKVKAQGGRIVRTDPKFGNVFDHFNAVFTFENNVKGFFSCRQWGGAHRDVSDHVYGTVGVAHTQQHYVEDDKGKRVWRYRPEDGVEQDMYNAEHNAMFASIRSGEPIHDGDIMCRATLLALMTRMSAYTGQEISWQQALESKEDLSPAKYEFGPNPVPPVAQPGITPFV